MEQDKQPHPYHIAQAEIWVRLLFMLVFIVALKISGVILGVLVLVQFIFAIADGQANQNLLKFCKGLTGFICQIWNYLTFVSEDKPFPFKDWPQ